MVGGVWKGGCDTTSNAKQGRHRHRIHAEASCGLTSITATIPSDSFSGYIPSSESIGPSDYFVQKCGLGLRRLPWLRYEWLGWSLRGLVLLPGTLALTRPSHTHRGTRSGGFPSGRATARCWTQRLVGVPTRLFIYVRSHLAGCFIRCGGSRGSFFITLKSNGPAVAMCAGGGPELDRR